VEALVKKMLSGSIPRPRQVTQVAPEMAALADEISQSLGTRVDIQQGPKGGRLVIHYYSDEELQAIYESIVGAS
jgi:ParB family chromosome partitioning protein